MDVIYKACSKAFDITQSLNTSQEGDAFFFPPATQDWRFNTDRLVRCLHGSCLETISWGSEYFVNTKKEGEKD